MTPGEAIRGLHRSGITGRGVGIAVVDSCLLTEHEEFAGGLRWYDEIGTSPADPARWHGTAVASIAAGRTVGVAPAAALCFVGIGANWRGERPDDCAGTCWHLPLAIGRILEVNRRLPPNRRIRVISLSTGSGLFGREEAAAAIAAARAEGIFVAALDLRAGRLGPVRVASPGGPPEYSYYPVPREAGRSPTSPAASHSPRSRIRAFHPSGFAFPDVRPKRASIRWKRAPRFQMERCR